MRDGAKASPSTLCRFERKSRPWEALKLHGVLFDQFVAAHPKPPERIVLDFDATDIALHPMQTCTGCRRGATGTATTVRTATCRFKSSAAGTCWRRCCSRPDIPGAVSPARPQKHGGRGSCARRPPNAAQSNGSPDRFVRKRQIT